MKNLKEFEKKFTAVTFAGKKYILANYANMQDDGETYIADAYDENLNKFKVYFETTEAWKKSIIVYNFELDGSDEDSEHISDEVQEAYQWIKNNHGANIDDESNACDWENPVKVIEVDADSYFENEIDLVEVIAELDRKYFEITDKINSEKANGDLGKLINLKTTFDETFDQFFDKKEIRLKYNDWNEEENCPCFGKTGRDLLELFDKTDLKDYIEFYEEYISRLEDELNDLISE